MEALIPVLLIAFIALYFFAKRKDKKVKTRIAWMLLISCAGIIVAGYEYLGQDYSNVLWPFGTMGGICIIWLIALKTQK